MWKRISLRVRIYVILAALVFTTFMGGLIMVWYTHRMQTLLTHLIDRNVAAFQAAEALETALVNQKGFVSYYFLDGDPDWLRKLERYRQVFKERLNLARSLVQTGHQEQAIGRIEREYREYIDAKDIVIAYYMAGERDKGARLHRKVRGRFFKILELCQDYKALHTEKIEQVRYEPFPCGKTKVFRRFRYADGPDPGIASGLCPGKPYPGSAQEVGPGDGPGGGPVGR